MKKIILLTITSLCTLSVFAQTAIPTTKPTTKEIVVNSYSDVSFGAGIYMNTQNQSLQHGTIYSLDYARFAYNNIGFRGGINLIEELGRDVSMVGVPLHFAWRSNIDKRSKRERLETSAYSFIAGGGDVASALLNLAPLRFELSGGITPYYATSKGNVTYGWSGDYGDYAESLLVKRRFALSADIGARLNIRIWRANIFFEPQYHYWLTNNFTHKIKVKHKSETFDVSRSYLSLLLGINFIF